MATFTNRGSVCSLLILFYISVLPTLIIIAEITDAEITDMFEGFLCYNDSQYADGGVFESNLNRVLHNLVQDTPKTGFSTCMYGESPNQIYGLLQCRGDTTAEQCYNCSQQANTTLRQKCLNDIGGIVWFEMCFLRYWNTSFIGELNIRVYLYLFFSSNISSPAVFNSTVDSLLRNLSVEATSGSELYAAGTTKDSLNRTIYGLVQCWRDISSDDCTTCLSNTIDTIVTSYYGSQGVEGLIASCRVRYDVFKFFNSPAVTQSSNSRQINHSDKSSNKLRIVLGGAFGGLLLVLLVCMFTTRRRLKSAILRRGYEVNEQVEEQTLVAEDPQILREQVEEDTVVSEDRQLLKFNMETLVAATKKFHDDNKLGQGGFGPVYKGTTHDGKEIAVKKLSLNSKQGKKEFLTEVKLLAKIQHRNLVKLLGGCAEGSERLLVYEYLPNSSLDKILFDPVKSKMLDWQKRYNIILGVVRGLVYLHEDSQPRIIHRDIKASNILLDENLNPKIADFGLAKLLPHDESSVSTLTKVAGTLGYMAPEYAMHGQLSAKADVYSFGVLLMELVTGRKNMDYNLPPEMQILLGWAWRSYEAGNSVEIIDRVAIIESCDEEQALKCIQVAIWCTQADPSLRPTMFTVSSMLLSHSVALPYLTKPVCSNSVPRFNTRNSSSGYGLSHHSSATTSYTLSDPVPASSSNATVSSIELVPR